MKTKMWKGKAHSMTKTSKMPLSNNYSIKKGRAVLSRIENTDNIYADKDFGWRQTNEITSNINHAALIPSAGRKFHYGKRLPDLLIKIVSPNLQFLKLT